MKNLQRVKKYISVLWLGAYIFVSGYSLLHNHNSNHFGEESYALQNNITINTGFHHDSFCLLHHFNSTLYFSDLNLFHQITPAELCVKENSSDLSLISSEINSNPKRGPPSLS
jgi:hypothetical protein